MPPSEEMRSDRYSGQWPQILCHSAHCHFFMAMNLSLPCICSDTQNTVEGCYSTLSLVPRELAVSISFLLESTHHASRKPKLNLTQKGQQEGILRHLANSHNWTPSQQPASTLPAQWVSHFEATPPAPVDILEATPPAPLIPGVVGINCPYSELCPNCQIVTNTWLLCFKPLSFEIVSYTTINHRNKIPYS